jgi:hypothetical protein
MSVWTTNTITLGYESTNEMTFSSPQTRAFTAQLINDDSFQLLRIQDQLLNWELVEKIIGYRYIYNVRLFNLSAADKTYLYQFVQSDTQTIAFGTGTLNVRLRDPNIAIEYIDGFAGATSLNLEFEDATLTVPSAPSVTIDNSVGYTVLAGTGNIVKLSFNYGSGTTSRNFRIASVTSYPVEVQRKEVKYIDWNNECKSLGIREIFDIDFGYFGIGQTETQRQNDRDWIRNFVLAPEKYIFVPGQYSAQVVCDFDEVRYDMSGGNVFLKTTQLRFRGKTIQSSLASVTTPFILDTTTLDTGVLQ